MYTIVSVIKIGPARKSKFPGGGLITTIECEDIATKEKKYAHVKHKVQSRYEGMMRIFTPGNAVWGSLRESENGKLNTIDVDNVNPSVATEEEIKKYLLGN